MCGIFAYINYLTPKTRRELIQILINGLHRLEYRGYDSAGMFSELDKKFYIAKYFYFILKFQELVNLPCSRNCTVQNECGIDGYCKQ